MESDLERARAVLRAQPFSVFLGAELAAFSADGCEIRLPVSERLTQQYGFVHGGVLSYLADNVMTFAGALALHGPALTAELKINYLRPAQGELLIARGHALGAGSTQSVVRCEIYAARTGSSGSAPRPRARSLWSAAGGALNERARRKSGVKVLDLSPPGCAISGSGAAAEKQTIRCASQPRGP
jgi:uncharacterized protein (TIGR00369 family)